MTHNPLCDFLIASCEDDGGIVRFKLYDDGTAVRTAFIPLPNPMWFEQSGNVLTVLLRAPFDSGNESGIAKYRLSDGTRLTPIISTQGVVGCHLAVDGDDIYCANYTSGSLICLPDKLVVHEGHGVNPVRQEAPHVHSTFLSPDKKYVLSCDLGLDTVFVYDRELHPVSESKVPSGSGPRHLCFGKDGSTVYVINEMGSSVSVFSYADGILTPINTVPYAKDGNGEKGAAIRISPDGRHLYVTERGDKTIILFDIGRDGTLSIVDRTDCRGEEPRDFQLVANGSFAVCTNQFEGKIVLFRVGTDGRLTYTNEYPVPGALCVAEIE